MEIEIESLSDLFKAISNLDLLNNDKKGYKLFYRGVSNKEWSEPYKDIPSIYRSHKEDDYDRKNLVQFEDKMYHDLVANCPDYFSDCRNTFEHLVMMQHYEYPTRLLDISENPLVALFFACADKNGYVSETDGKIIIYAVPEKDIKNYASDTVCMVSNLARMKYEFLITTVEIFKFIHEINNLVYQYRYCAIDDLVDILNFKLENILLIDELTSDDDKLNDLADYSNYLNIINDLKQLIEYIKSAKNKINNIEIEEFFSQILYQTESINIRLNEIQDYSLINFFQKIKEEKPYFDPTRVIVNDLSKVHCVIPRRNNKRLINQRGAFFLFGVSGFSNKLIPSNNGIENYYAKANGKRIELLVHKDKKENILKELKLISISPSTMFPEIENVANELKKTFIEKIT